MLAFLAYLVLQLQNMVVEEKIGKLYETNDCLIYFLTDTSEKKFIIKQIKDTSPNEQFLLVLDAVGCHIAEQTFVPMNRVTIIPAAVAHLGKTRTDYPATIHMMAPGVSTEEECIYHSIDIHQRFRKENSSLWQKYGPLTPEATGLTIDVIQNMAKHPDLPKIVALDTFIGNADRSAPNLFYDAETDRFCGIDMAASFNTDLAKEACRQIQLIETMQITLSKMEKEALRQYASTLETLLKNYPPDKQVDLLLEYGKMAGFQEGLPLWNENVKERIEFHKKRIQSNYEFSQKLVPLIYRLVDRKD
jgi:hypothetical protein